MHTSQTVSGQVAQRLELGAERTHPVVDEALRDALGRRDDSVREARWVLQRRGEAKSISCQLVGRCAEGAEASRGERRDARQLQN